MTAPAALDHIDDGLPVTVEQRADLALFERHSSDYWYRRDLKADVRPTDVCACGDRKEPGEFECNGCFLDHDDLMRRAEDI